MHKIAFAFASLATLLTATGAASANCERYEFAELRVMETSKLKLNYCLNVIEISRQAQRMKTASKMSDLELRNPMGVSRRELEKNAAATDAAEVKLGQCRQENERIVGVLSRKKFNVAAMQKECI